jgi:N-acetylglucosamine kinase
VARFFALELAGPLAMVVNTLAATIVPVGGGLANAPDLIARLDAEVRPLSLRQSTAPLVVPALCGPDAGLIGAAEAADRGAADTAVAPCPAGA